MGVRLAEEDIQRVVIHGMGHGGAPGIPDRES